MIRPARIEDFERVNAVLYSSLGLLNSRRFFEQKVREKRLYVYEVGGQVVGVVDVVDEGDGLYIAALAVAERYRGMGFGRGLLRYVITLAEKLGKKYVYAHPLESSEEFFRRFGFTIVEEWEGNLVERVAVYCLPGGGACVKSMGRRGGRF